MPDKSILDKILNAIFRVILPDKVILFGSQAQGNARPDSDYDILIIKAGIENEREINQAIYRVLVDIDLPVGVDIIVKTPENLKKNLNMTSSVVKEAFEKGVVIYG